MNFVFIQELRFLKIINMLIWLNKSLKDIQKDLQQSYRSYINSDPKLQGSELQGTELL